ncbi:AmmeMemoRadiSam system radical SAM enzyme [Haliangium ochraceum]|uniref:Radical SAM domain protein n=1 Tax=Haliangium ochraceum (strain DSM 14365 / JCM 11303 / SMP-2) TaxID=502025 RepID=D0LHG8_HALO1|nr:AmmeMemoRadiSam system radical SAM enzyme [Haliangium ochraceum]ACY12830.1 Radical SAM domain protein [Haliangium ochraceum DSM 14365]
MSEPAMRWQPAGFYRPGTRGPVCTLCPRQCELSEGALGYCQVRRRRGAGLETATFATSVWHLQAIERKPLYHVRPGSRVLTVAAPGCTFRCSYCQNFRISQLGRDVEARWDARPLAPEELAAAAAEADATIAFSYAEPILSTELTLAVAEQARARGGAVVWKSNGFASTEAALRLARALDAACVDLKSADEAAHHMLTGARLRPVLDTLATWRAAGVWLEVATPVIPDFNSAPEDLRAIARLVYALGADTPWHLLRFHPDYRMGDTPPTSPALLQTARDIGHDIGLRHVYVERALGQDARDTRCPSCQRVVVERAIWGLRALHLRAGRCEFCDTAIAGRWEMPA